MPPPCSGKKCVTINSRTVSDPRGQSWRGATPHRDELESVRQRTQCAAVARGGMNHPLEFEPRPLDPRVPLPPLLICVRRWHAEPTIPQLVEHCQRNPARGTLVGVVLQQE